MTSVSRKIAALWLIAVLAAVLVVPGTRRAGAVSAANVVVTPPVTSVFGQYDIEFTTSSALGANSGTIQLVFPLGSVLPCGCGGVGWNASDFTINGYVPAVSPTGEAEQNRVTLTTPVGIAAKETVRIRVRQSAMIKNPFRAGSYRMAIHTSSEATPVDSLPYVISDSTVSGVQVAVVPAYAGNATSLAIDFKTGVHGALTAHEGNIIVGFPDAFNVPSSLPRSSVAINGVIPAAAGQWQGHTLTIPVPLDVKAESTVRVDISDRAGITLPLAEGKYQVTISTTSETTPVSSVPIEVAPSPQVRASIVVMPGDLPDGGGGYYMHSVTCVVMASSNTGSTATIHYRTDGGTWQFSMGAPVMLVLNDGTHTVEYWVDDGLSRDPADTAAVYSRTFLIDSTAPQVVLSKPDAVTTTVRTSTFAVEGHVVGLGEGGTVAVNDVPVIADAQGRFSYQVQLAEGANTVEVRATDAAGNTGSAIATVLLVTEVPKITIVSPANWQEIKGGKVTVTGSVNVASVVTANGQPATVLDDGSFTCDLDIGVTGERLVVITVVATAKTSGLASQKVVMVTRAAEIPPKPDTVLKLTIGTSAAIVNGTLTALDCAPFIDKSTNRTLVPFRFIGEALGGVVGWEPTTQAITISLAGHTVQLAIGQTTAVRDGQAIAIEQAPVIVPPGRTMVPLRFVAEALGAEVAWDGTSHTATVTYHQQS